jgi:hypothetical protein
MKKIAIPIDSIYKYFQFWNGVFKLTTKELEILHAFVECSNNLKNLCTLDDKKCVATALNIKDKNTLNNYIKKLKDKNAIVKVNNSYTLNKFLNPKNGDVQISISWR